MPQPDSPSVNVARVHPAHAAKVTQSNKMIPSGLLVTDRRQSGGNYLLAMFATIVYSHYTQRSGML